MVKSPLKYLGGKSRQLGMILPLLPGGEAGRIVEPFCGSAVVSVNHPSRTKWLNDIDAHIMALWRAVMRDPDGLIDDCERIWKQYPNTREGFELARARFNAMPNPDLLLFLNKTSFNGMLRRNKKGWVNSPFGAMKAPRIPVDDILRYHAALACPDTLLTSMDFEKVIDQCGAGDILYCDPPFAPLSKTASYTGYTGEWRGEDDLVRLDAALTHATKRGALAVVSASDTEVSRRAHQHASVVFQIEAHRSISCKGDGRQPAKELLYVYRET
jgi:DNA adenine methylase